MQEMLVLAVRTMKCRVLKCRMGCARGIFLSVEEDRQEHDNTVAGRRETFPTSGCERTGGLTVVPGGSGYATATRRRPVLNRKWKNVCTDPETLRLTTALTCACTIRVSVPSVSPDVNCEICPYELDVACWNVNKSLAQCDFPHIFGIGSSTGISSARNPTFPTRR